MRRQKVDAATKVGVQGRQQGDEETWLHAARTRKDWAGHCVRRPGIVMELLMILQETAISLADVVGVTGDISSPHQPRKARPSAVTRLHLSE